MSIYQMVVKGSAGTGIQLRNIHHFEFPGYVPTPAELEEAAEALATHYETWLVNMFAAQVSIRAIDLRRVDIGDLPTQEYVPDGWPVSGTGTGDMLPTQVSALVIWKAPTTYPRSTRTYVFPMTETASGPVGGIQSANVTALFGFSIDMETLAITGQTDANKVAVEYGGVPRAVILSNPVSAAPVPNVWATQRRRRPGVGI
jgi:hypothetical protein